MSNGILNIWGTQYGIPPGNWKDQLSVPYSDIIQVTYIATNTGPAAIDIPVGCQGVIIIPTADGETPSVKFNVTANPLWWISPTYPTVITFDPNHLPDYCEFTTVNCIVTVRFF